MNYSQINTSNITFYEDEKTFQDIHRAIKLTSENISQEEKKNEKEHEKTHTQNDVENKVPVPGIVDYESDSEKVAEMVVENEIGEMKIDENSVDSVEMHDKYGLYKMFWGLQEFMCTENVKRFVDCAAVVGEAGNDVIRYYITRFVVIVIIIIVITKKLVATIIIVIILINVIAVLFNVRQQVTI